MQYNPGQMSIELMETIIKRVAESSFRNILFLIHGGEPTSINLDLLKTFIELQNQYIGKTKKVENFIQTNGTLLSSNLVEVFKKYNISVGISLDGPKEVHDYYRRFKNGAGSYNTVMDNIRTISDNGIEFGILSVCSDITFNNLKKIYPFFKSLKSMKMLDLLLSDPSQNGNVLSKGHLSRIMLSLFDDWFMDTECTFDFRFFSSLILDMLFIVNRKTCLLTRNCITNGSNISIDINGNISPCDSFTDIELGSISDYPFDYFFSRNPMRRKYGFHEEKRIEPCGFCEWYRICYGGCPLHVDNNGGVNFYCEDYKIIFKYIMDRLTMIGVINDGNPDFNAIGEIPNPKMKDILKEAIKVNATEN